MECTLILVRPARREGWVIDTAVREMGPYHTRDIGLRVAIAEALSIRRAGRPARVVLQGNDGTIIAERCLCAGFGR